MPSCTGMYMWGKKSSSCNIEGHHSKNHGWLLPSTRHLLKVFYGSGCVRPCELNMKIRLPCAEPDGVGVGGLRKRPKGTSQWQIIVGEQLRRESGEQKERSIVGKYIQISPFQCSDTYNCMAEWFRKITNL